MKTTLFFYAILMLSIGCSSGTPYFEGSRKAAELATGRSIARTKLKLMSPKELAKTCGTKGTHGPGTTEGTVIGCYYPGSKYIYIRSDLDVEDMCSTAAHEYVHHSERMYIEEYTEHTYYMAEQLGKLLCPGEGYDPNWGSETSL